MMGVGVVLITAMVVTVFPTNAGLAGLALTSALNLTGKPYTNHTLEVIVIHMGLFLSFQLKAKLTTFI